MTSSIIADPIGTDATGVVYSTQGGVLTGELVLRDTTPKIIFSLDRASSIAPQKATEGSAGYDMFADLGERETLIIPAGATVLVPTGVRTFFDAGFVAKVYARSGLAVKHGLRPANCVGVIDSDYSGEIFVPLYNDSLAEYMLMHAMRIGQLLIEYSPVVRLVQQPVAMVKALHESSVRGEGGFGSTGLQLLTEGI